MLYSLIKKDTLLNFMMKTYFKILFLFLAFIFISCDKEFNTVGSDLIGDEHFVHDVDETATIKAYTVPTGEVQTNNLPTNPLGIYENDVFGTTKANFVTQLTLSTGNPDFGTNVQIENVVLYIPLFSTVATSSTDGSKTYTLDSIYAKNFILDQHIDDLDDKKFKLSVYENGYYLNTTDPNDNFLSNQKFYSDLDATINTWKKGHDGNGNSVANGMRLNDSPNASQNDQFYFNKNEIIVYKRKLINGNYVYVDANDVQLADQNDVSVRVVKERLAPGIYLELNKEYFKKKILQASSANIYNNNAFKEYFRGLYFQTEQISGVDPAMAMLNFSNAKLSIDYTSISTGATDATSKTFNITMGINSGANTVSLQQNNFSSDYIAHLNSPSNDISLPNNAVLGQNANLYLKGGKGSVVYIDLFGNNNVDVYGRSAELRQYREKGWLINDAYLTFFIDQNKMAALEKSEEPLRLYLFDATNQKALIDYTFDTSTNTNVKKSKVVHGGIIEVDANGKGTQYKIRITNYINNLFNSKEADASKDINKNVRLGLCISETIATTSNYYYKTSKNLPNFQSQTTGQVQEVKYFPAASIMSPMGTVLHGTNAADAAKRLKLVINYTKPN